VPRGPDVRTESPGGSSTKRSDAGINFIDTVDRLRQKSGSFGKYIGHRRSEFFLALSAAASPTIRRMCWAMPTTTHAPCPSGVEHSLRRIGTDHLDLVQIHVSPSRAELEANDTVTEMLALKSEGKVRFIGNVPAGLPDLSRTIDMGVFGRLPGPLLRGPSASTKP